jgi:hypothetical protein
MRMVGGVTASGATKNVDIVRVFGSLSGIDHSTGANDPRPSASFSTRKNPQRISANTPSGFSWPAALHLAAAPSPRHERQCRKAPPAMSSVLFKKRLHLIEETLAIFFYRHPTLFGKFFEQFFLTSIQFRWNLNLDNI